MKALVYVAAFAPDTGETALELAGQFPGSTLGPALAPPVALPDGGKELYIQQDKFHAQFAADVPEARREADGRQPAAGDRGRASTRLRRPGLEDDPSWFIYGES